MKANTRFIGLVGVVTAVVHAGAAGGAETIDAGSPATTPSPAVAQGSPASPRTPIGAREEVPTPVRGPSQPGYIISTAGGDTLLVGGYIHADARAFTGYGGNAYVNQFLLRQVRPVLEGTLRNHFDFRLLPDFAGGRLVVQEAWADVRYISEVKVRVGKMKEPVGLERIENSNAVVFAERAFPTNLAPNRNLGAQVFGDVGGAVSYAVGIFDGSVDNGITESDQGSNKEGAARIFLSPLATTGIAPLKGLGFGVAGTWSAPSGTAASPLLPVILSPGQNPIFSYASGSTNGTPDPAKTAVADGDHVRWNVQGYYYYGPLGLQSEYASSKQRVRRGAAAVHAANWAWDATASVVLTGENATYGMIVPDRPLDVAAERWGAIELAARYQVIRLDGDLFAGNLFADPTQQVRGANGWGVGVNWYLERSFRLMVDYDRTMFHGGASSAGREVDRNPENALVARAQVVF